MTLTVKQILPAQEGEVIVVLRGDQDAFFSRRFDAGVAEMFTPGDEWEFIPVRKTDWIANKGGLHEYKI